MTSDLTKDFGTIRAWKRTYGFITPDGNNGNDVFFPGNELKSGGDPKPGQRCSYFLAPSRKDRSQIVAVDVVVL